MCSSIEELQGECSMDGLTPLRLPESREEALVVLRQAKLDVLLFMDMEGPWVLKLLGDTRIAPIQVCSMGSGSSSTTTSGISSTGCWIRSSSNSGKIIVGSSITVVVLVLILRLPINACSIICFFFLQCKINATTSNFFWYSFSQK